VLPTLPMQLPILAMCFCKQATNVSQRRTPRRGRMPATTKLPISKTDYSVFTRATASPINFPDGCTHLDCKPNNDYSPAQRFRKSRLPLEPPLLTPPSTVVEVLDRSGRPVGQAISPPWIWKTNNPQSPIPNPPNHDLPTAQGRTRRILGDVERRQGMVKMSVVTQCYHLHSGVMCEGITRS